MLKKIILYFFLLVSLFLVSCGKSDNKDIIQIKFGPYNMSLDKTYYVAGLNTNIKDINVLYTYKKNTDSKVKPSLLIGEYDSYPKDKNTFFSIMLDKLQKEIVGLSVLDKGEFNIGNDSVYYVKYQVNNNLFGGNDDIYYGLQAYIMDNENKKVYIISYISLEETDINDIFDNIKNLEYNN